MRKFLALIIVLSSSYSLYSRQKITPPLIWNVDKIEEVKDDVKYKKLYTHIVLMADSFCATKPVIVTDTKEPFSNNEHYYCSTGPYWWPDTTSTGIKYIRRDGYINPDYYNSDSEQIKELAKRCKYLSVAFYLTNDRKYYRAYIKQIRAWFINKDTYMYPSFEYAQVIPGENGNKGRSTGLIEAYSFNTVLESMRLIEMIKKVDRRTFTGIKKWMSTFASWMQESEYGIKQSKSTTNLSIAYDVTLINMNEFCSQISNAQEIVTSFYDKRILTQITEEGLQPLELSRTKAYMYSVMNLSHIVDFLYITNRCLLDNYLDIPQQRIVKAFNYLLAFVDDADSFPYQELNRHKWESCAQSCIYEWNRYEYLVQHKDYEISMNQAMTSAFNSLVN